ncbi:MAG TPA: hypothetical protein VG034_29360, partial [Acidimicrobiia bacterium]|nr:hypothetical protein [Acidimicrobiia bacterium]
LALALASGPGPNQLGRLQRTATLRQSQGYWLLGADGGVFSFGDAGSFGAHRNRDSDIAGLARTRDGGGLWAVDDDGDVFHYGNAINYGSRLLDTNDIAGFAARPQGDGYWMASQGGSVWAFGAAGHHGPAVVSPLNRPIVDMAATPSGQGYWLVASDGGVFSYGDAGFYGSTGAIVLNRPVVGMAATPSGGGYWLVASDGGVFSFGDAGFYGSTGAMRLNRPIVGMAATPSGAGYWLVATDGGVFAFGDAAFFGSTGGIVLNKPITGMSASRTGRGYRFVASDGGLFSFGDAAYAGSAAGRRMANPIVGVAGSPTGNGYWLAGSTGAVYAYGDARGLHQPPSTENGSTAGSPITAPIVTIVAQPKAPDGPLPAATPAEPSDPAEAPSAPAPGGAFEIALIGDTGYAPDQDQLLLKTRTAISSRPYAFVVHDGDIQNPADPCTDERLAYVYDVFDGFSIPFVFAPGDNEWADCPDPAPRLDAIRHRFFATDQSLGQRRMTLTRQEAPFVENARWMAGNVVFATFNVPGPTGRSSGAKGLSEANIAWLNAAFETAEAQQSPGLMLIWQDDPFDGNSDDELEDALLRRARAFGKPVVLVHGDTHVYRLGKPWREAPNLIELQTFAVENIDWWVEVTVDPASADVFRFAKAQS